MKIMMKIMFVVSLFVLAFVLPGHLTTAQAQSSWRLKEFGKYNSMDGKHGTVTSERHDASGGTVIIHLSGDIHSFCPGGFEKVRFDWRFPNNISEVVNGGVVSVSLSGGQGEKSRNCGTQLASRSYMSMRPGSFAYQGSRTIDRERFLSSKGGERVWAAEGTKSATGSVNVNTHRFNPELPLAYFEVYIETPAGNLTYAYLYENSGGGSTGGSSGGGSGWGQFREGSINQGDATIVTYYRGTTPQQCRADCDKNSRCEAFTFIKAGAYNPNDPPMCYLLSAPKKITPSGCCISAIKNTSNSNVLRRFRWTQDIFQGAERFILSSDGTSFSGH